jgi:hypothetical protein
MWIQAVTGNYGEDGRGAGEGVSGVVLMAMIGVDLRDCIERAMTGEGGRPRTVADRSPEIHVSEKIDSRITKVVR